MPADSAEIFVKSLVNSGHVILFSAAIPYQGGQNHNNEQWLTYWENLFLNHNFVIHDVLRPIFWDNPEIFWWYKQNMVLIAHEDYKLSSNAKYSLLRNVVHYELYNLINLELESVKKGKEKKLYYLKLLLKSFFESKHKQKNITKLKS